MDSIKLNIGCGRDKRVGCVNIDIDKSMNPDMVIDLEKGKLPFKDNSVDEILALEVLEHVRNLEKLLEELYRVMKPGAVLELSVPYKDAQLSLHHIWRFDKDFFKSWDRDWYEAKEGVGSHIFKFNFETKTLKLRGNRLALLLPFKTWRGFFEHLISGIYAELVKK